MFVTHGPVPPESRLFVGRAAELKRLGAWLSDVHCVGAVLGARQTGKTSLLLKLRHAFRDKYGFTFVDLQGVEGAQTDDCFNYIAEQMVEQLAETVGGEDGAFGSNSEYVECSRILGSLLPKAVSTPIVGGISDVRERSSCL